jgi:hypothetical protein
MNKELLKLARMLGKREEAIDSVFETSTFLHDEIDFVWGLIEQSYNIDPFLSYDKKDDALDTINKVTDGKISITEADRQLKEFNK